MSQFSCYFVHPLLRARDWQHRSEFDQICDWWRSSTGGVCALVGIGGSGKTAIADRLIQVIPELLPVHPDVPKRADLPTPERLFVFSFYDSPNADDFFVELSAWLLRLQGKDTREGSEESYHRIRDTLSNIGSCLVILDGLERIQNDGLRGGALGQIGDGRLKDLVLRVADGWLPQVSLLITTRFRLYDPMASRSLYCRQINVEHLEPSAAIQLLRRRGVIKGSDDLLFEIAQQHGSHPLSIDLIGGYIGRFCDGDPTQMPAMPEIDISDLDPNLKPEDRAIIEQERRFTRVVKRYHDVLSISDPGALALLQRVCIFRLGANAETLAAIFTGGEKSEVSEAKLAALSQSEVERKLRFLSEMRLLEKDQGLESSFPEPRYLSCYKIHPAVRDAFLGGLTADVLRSSHEAASAYLTASLGAGPGVLPTESRILDLVEEIIHHKIEAGHAHEALDLYRTRLGGFPHLGHTLGQFNRGRRMCYSLIDGVMRYSSQFAEFTMDDEDVPFLLTETSMYLRSLGAIAEAEHFLSHAMATSHTGAMHPGLCSHWGLDWRGPLERTFAMATLKTDRGRLVDARKLADKVELTVSQVRTVSVQSSDEVFAELSNDVALLTTSIDVLRGRVGMICALESHLTSATTSSGFHFDLTVVIPSLICSWFRPNREAGIATQRTLNRGVDDDDARNLIVCSAAAMMIDDYSRARIAIAKTIERAVARDEIGTLCWSKLIQSRIENAELCRTIKRQPQNESSYELRDTKDRLVKASVALEDGLRIARTGGFGICHIELVLERARLHLLWGHAGDALDDIEVALDTGIPANQETGQSQLLAANHEECGYAWAIPAGLQLRAEALLLQAAQQLGSATINRGAMGHGSLVDGDPTEPHASA